MSQFFPKIAKLLLWVIVPTLFISGTKWDSQAFSTVDTDKDYTFQVTGNLNNNLSGVINFETSIVTTSKGIPFSTLKLKFGQTENAIQHSMEFLISRENAKGLIPKGTYEVSRNQDGFLNYFDGVFGFANIHVLGEVPLFAKSGEIQIDYLDKATVKGRLNIQMSNANGRSVQIKGNFISKR